MKNLRMIVFATLVTLTVSAQDLRMDEVPANLITDFQKNHKTALDVEWEMEGDNYKVEFDEGKLDYEIWYTKSSEVVKSKKEITERDLPSAILSVIKSKYSGYKVDEAKVTELNKNKRYEVELDKGWEEELKVVFDEKGNVISSIKD
ncbi:PepSY-like domain-containing protein [Winogradskyella undariae]|uniref:PepSY-like domain-containing protein n=1 Tax=Winogradskyella undariae TaxID=1285465 RepID=UPI00156B069B|nr:PepSY-like domain-containing protein [Winogradskyella undariae]NRR90278.1 PepSY-like domain-containing protein [Winogradskyella undariae]